MVEEKLAELVERPPQTKRKRLPSTKGFTSKKSSKSGDSKVNKDKSGYGSDSETDPTVKAEHGKEGHKDQLKARIPKPTTPIFVIGVDLGMTQSGISFCSDTAEPEKVSNETSWPGTRGCYTKVPTAIAYKAENPGHPDFGEDEESRFGFDVPAGAAHHALFKGVLDADAPTTKFDNPVLHGEHAGVLLKKSQADAGRKAAVDTFRHLKNYALGFIVKQAGGEEAVLDKSTLIWAISYPSACTTGGRENTYLAAFEAGLQRPGHKDRIVMIPEADAACLAAATDNNATLGMQDSVWTRTSKYNGLIITIDIGGLTCDAATLRVTGTNPFTLEQVCQPQGGKCGVMAMSCLLHKYLLELFGEPFQRRSERVIGHGSPLLRDFEEELLKFDGKKLDAKIRLQLAMPRGFKHEQHQMGKVVLTGHDVKAMFDENFRYIQAILEDQIQQDKTDAKRKKLKGYSVQAIVLCGGGAKFPYITALIRSFCQHYPSGPITLIEPHAPEGVVSRSACINSLGKHILVNQTLRFGFGIAVAKPCEHGIWNPVDEYRSSDGTKMVRGFMKWHVEPGMTIDTSKHNEGRSFTVDMILTSAELDLDRKLVVHIHQYSGEKTPPERHDHPSCRVAGRLEIDLAKMSKNATAALMRELQESPEATVTFSVKQLVAVDQGKIQFEAKIFGKVVGTFNLDHEATQASA